MARTPANPPSSCMGLAMTSSPFLSTSTLDDARSRRDSSRLIPSTSSWRSDSRAVPLTTAGGGGETAARRVARAFSLPPFGFSFLGGAKSPDGSKPSPSSPRNDVRQYVELFFALPPSSSDDDRSNLSSTPSALRSSASLRTSGRSSV
eukprot:CAMPEP_0181103838 /NCGR_PEP_ID=MMETSP1071-20121207/15095_1 /TAXON_ID=35127 /ORGANISM="Thalassiosira sp., Strain NH16" /LENGTH=147 /DNA_ID=CAMNT_0023186971 /DNA_START=8 /DNA_END=447 /DNA_ORIENTATION=+